MSRKHSCEVVCLLNKKSLSNVGNIRCNWLRTKNLGSLPSAQYAEHKCIFISHPKAAKEKEKEKEKEETGTRHFPGAGVLELVPSGYRIKCDSNPLGPGSWPSLKWSLSMTFASQRSLMMSSNLQMKFLVLCLHQPASQAMSLFSPSE